jgi:hypothetical protein
VSRSSGRKDWLISVTNRFRYFLVDDANRIIDAVLLVARNGFIDVGGELQRPIEGVGSLLANVWDRTPAVNPALNWSVGIQNQLDISRIGRATDESEWKDYGQFIKSKDDAIVAFQNFIADAGPTALTEMQVPFTPIRLMVQTNDWQVNDPLVHYTVDDMGGLPTGQATIGLSRLADIEVNSMNQRYQPWGGGRDPENEGSRDLFNFRFRDPSMYGSDWWDFPTNKFPSVGWLGRVHRGTPWQTVFFKAVPPLPDAWRTHIGIHRNPKVAAAMRPDNDWRLADIFTASIHPSATRGRLSINQTNLAAWSAVLSGGFATSITNEAAADPPVHGTNEVIAPASASANREVELIVADINIARASLPTRQFHRLSDILSVTNLTVGSPYFTKSGFDAATPPNLMAVTDADYERIPQQILGLLKVGEPRFVVYSWGQSLKPGEFGVEQQGNRTVPRGPSVTTSGDDRGLVGNYQITGELATRAVLSIQFPHLTNNPASPLYHQFDYRKPRAVIESYNLIPPE